MVTEFPFCKMQNVLEIGCMTRCMWLTLLSVPTLTNGKVANFMQYIFYHNKEKERRLGSLGVIYGVQ